MKGESVLLKGACSVAAGRVLSSSSASVSRSEEFGNTRTNIGVAFGIRLRLLADDEYKVGTARGTSSMLHTLSGIQTLKSATLLVLQSACAYLPTVQLHNVAKGTSQTPTAGRRLLWRFVLKGIGPLSFLLSSTASTNSTVVD